MLNILSTHILTEYLIMTLHDRRFIFQTANVGQKKFVCNILDLFRHHTLQFRASNDYFSPLLAETANL